MGQSLGTAVTAAVAERFAFGSPDPSLAQPVLKNADPFAGVILLASFSTVPSLIESYSFKGITPPLLSPLIGYPRVQKWVMGSIVDHWDTASRVARLTGVGPSSGDDEMAGYGEKELDLSIVHAIDDFEIPWYEGRRVWQAAIGEGTDNKSGEVVSELKEADGPGEVRVWENKSGKKDGAVKRVRWERVGYGGMYLLLDLGLLQIGWLADVFLSRS